MAPTNGSRVPTSPCTKDILSSHSKLVSSSQYLPQMGNILQNIFVAFSFITNVSSVALRNEAADLVCLTSSFVVDAYDVSDV